MARKARPKLRVNHLEDRCAPAAFAVTLGGAAPGEGKAVATDPTGNAVFAGTVSPHDGDAPAVVVSKFGPDGTPLWTKALAADAPWTAVQGVASDAAGDVYVAGQFTGTGDFDPGPGTAPLTAPPRTWDGDVHVQIETVNSFVVKLDPAGNFLWARALGAGGVAEVGGLGADAAGNTIVVGQFMGHPDFDPGPGAHPLDSVRDPDAFVAKLDPAGGLLWADAFGGPEPVTARDVAVTPDGAAFVGGSFTGELKFSDTLKASAPGFLGAYLARVDADGKIAWAKSFGGPGTADLAAVAIDGAGAAYAVGTFTGTADFDPGPLNATIDAGDDAGVFVTKLTSAGDWRWAHGFGGAQAAEAAADDRGVYVTGDFRGTADFDPGPKEFNLTADHGDLFLDRLNADGDFAGARALGGPGDDRGEAVAATGDDLYAAGSFEGQMTIATADGSRTLNAGGYPDAFLARLSVPPPVPPNTPPTVNVDATFATVEGQDLALGATAADREGDRLTYAWDVNGDGDFADATGPAPTVSWDKLRRLGITDSTPGRPMAVRVADAVNPPVTVPVSLLVENTAPRATFRAGPPVREGASGFVSFAGQTDPAAADRVAGFRYSYDFDGNGIWDLGDGKTYAGGSMNASAVVPANVLADSGSHTVRARIFDKDGGYADYQAAIAVTNVAPRGRLLTDGPVIEARPGLVRFANVIDPSPADRRAGFRYSYDFNGDGAFEIGDGTTYAGSVTAAQYRVPAAFLADGPGTVTVRARVFDMDGGYTEASVPVAVTNAPPTARLRALGRAVVGKPVTVAFGGQSDGSAADRAAGYTYGFDLDGDGLFEVTGRAPAATHTFARVGPQTVRAMITDKDGGSTVYPLTLLVDPVDTLKLLAGM
ncbi:MAG TPA: hypothetical protein VKD90_06455 [Gemmataceae bacterium]|nr:hypothetical protein [Gemmataceae bacterium]